MQYLIYFLIGRLHLAWGLSLAFTFFYMAELYSAERPLALVSVSVYRFFAQRIAGDVVTVESVVPPGASLHTFEPTVKQMMQAARADLWFTIGEQFESRMWQALHSYNPSMEKVDLCRGVPMIAAEGHEKCAHSGAYDLHMWLSPRVAGHQVDLIAQALEQHYPNHAAGFSMRAAALKRELLALDSEIKVKMGDRGKRLVLVSHPAFAYFGRDYDVAQLSIEVEGRDPTPRQLTQLLVEARRAKISEVYIEPQYSNKGAFLIAQQLKAHVVEIDPYGEDYFAILRLITDHFSRAVRLP